VLLVVLLLPLSVPMYDGELDHSGGGGGCGSCGGPLPLPLPSPLRGGA